MDRKLIDYLPPVLQQITEFIVITSAQQQEIENAWNALDLLMSNQFIDTATAEGVSIWEKELNIIPINTDTLEQRKQRIKAAWNFGVVYTYNWLVNWLKTFCGSDITRPVIDGYTTHAYLPISVDYIHILDNMRRYIPANVLIDPLILLTEIEMPHYTGSAFCLGTEQSITSDSWNTTGITMLSDEAGNVLMDGSEILYEEATV